MKKFLAALPLVLLAAACGSSGGAAPTTVTRTVTVAARASAAAAGDPSDGASDGSSDGASDSSAPAAGAAPDACSLLTQAEAEKVAGTPLMKPVGAGANAAGANVECQFTGPTTGPTAQLEIYVGDGAKQQLHIERDNLKHTFTTVPGIGDQCVQEEGWIFVEKNGLWASMRLVRLDDSALHVTPLQTGMKQLAARLP